MSTYWKRKEKAMKYGKPNERPQDEDGMRKFLLHRRKKNFNYQNQLHPFRTEIRNWIPDASTMRVPANFYKSVDLQNWQRFLFVETPEAFDFLLDCLYDVDVFALDLEFNDDHSFLGMTCLIQISTYNWDFFIDPFKLFEEIQAQLKFVLESGYWTKIIHGCTNDVRNLQRDFGIFIVGVIDTQIMFKEYDKSAEGVLKFDKLAAQFFSKTELAYLTDEEKDCLTLADFRQRPLPAKLILYARADVHVLIRIYFEMQKTIPNSCFYESVRKSNCLLLKQGLKYEAPLEANSLTDPLVGNNKLFKLLTQVETLTFKMIYQWRQDLAKRIDEKPEYIITSNDILHRIRSPSIAFEVFETLVMKYSESFKNQRVVFSRLLQDNRYFDQLSNNMCHNCNQAGHCAWGCVEDYSKANQQRFFESHPESKTQVNRRRRQQRDANRRAFNQQ